MRISKQDKRVNFSKILEESRQCTVFLPSSISECLQCISYIVGWHNRYDRISFVTNDQFITFFQNLDLPESVKFTTDSKNGDKKDENISINLYKKKKIKSHPPKKKKVVFDINNKGNIHFLPSPDSCIELIHEISYYCQLPYKNTDLSIKKDQTEQYAIPFVQNQKNNIVFHTSKLTNLPLLINKISERAKVNFYVCGKINGKLHNMGVRSIQPNSFYELFLIARRSDILLTDNDETHQVLTKYEVNALRLPSKLVFSANHGQIKNLLNEIDKYIFNKQ